MKKYLLLYLLMFPILSEAKINYDDLWRLANAFYSQKAYDSAAAYYEKIAALQPSNAEVYYNLGNTYYKLNKIGSSVLYYRRALRINPSYQAAKDNLYLTESRIGNRIQGNQEIFFVRWWKNITNPTMENNWAIAALVLFFICLGALVLRRWRNVPIPQQIPLLAGLLSLVCLLLSYVAADNMVSHTEAVVMTADAPMMENLKSAKASSFIPEGTVIEIEGQQGNWLQIKLPDGRAGYMQKQDLQKI